MVLTEDIDTCIVEVLAMGGLDGLEAGVLHRRPELDGFVGTGTYHVLSLIEQGELSCVYLCCVPLQATNELTIGTIEEPYHKVLAPSD
jgi:hypothetical protein